MSRVENGRISNSQERQRVGGLASIDEARRGPVNQSFDANNRTF